MLRISNHTACRFAEKTLFFRSLLAGRRCAAASRFTFFKGETLYPPFFPPCRRGTAGGRLERGPGETSGGSDGRFLKGEGGA